MAMARRQSLIQLNDELLALLDERAARSGRSRSSLIREAIEHFLAADIDSRIDAALVTGYERCPQEPDRWADVVSREAIVAEPW